MLFILLEGKQFVFISWEFEMDHSSIFLPASLLVKSTKLLGSSLRLVPAWLRPSEAGRVLPGGQVVFPGFSGLHTYQLITSQGSNPIWSYLRKLLLTCGRLTSFLPVLRFLTLACYCQNILERGVKPQNVKMENSTSDAYHKWFHLPLHCTCSKDMGSFL